MTETAVAADLGQALDIKSSLAAQVALNDEVVVDALTQLGLFLVGDSKVAKGSMSRSTVSGMKTLAQRKGKFALSMSL